MAGPVVPQAAVAHQQLGQGDEADVEPGRALVQRLEVRGGAGGDGLAAAEVGEGGVSVKHGELKRLKSLQDQPSKIVGIHLHDHVPDDVLRVLPEGADLLQRGHHTRETELLVALVLSHNVLAVIKENIKEPT